MNSSIRSTTSKLYYHITTHQKHDQCKIVIRLAFLSILTDHRTRSSTPPSTRAMEVPTVNVAIRKSKSKYSLFDSIWWIHRCRCGADWKCWKPCTQVAICLNIRIVVVVERNVMKNKETERILIVCLRDDLQSGGSGTTITISPFFTAPFEPCQKLLM